MNTERNSLASSVRTSSLSIQEPEELAQSSIFSSGFGQFTSIFPPLLNLEVIIPFTTPTYTPLISSIDLRETMNLGTESAEPSSSFQKKMNMPFSGNRDIFK